MCGPTEQSLNAYIWVGVGVEFTTENINSKRDFTSGRPMPNNAEEVAIVELQQQNQSQHQVESDNQPCMNAAVVVGSHFMLLWQLQRLTLRTE